MAYLIVVAGEEKGRKVPLPPSGEIVLGRGAVDVIFSDGRLSRKHCAVEATDEGYVVRDLGSTNGVFLNGRRIKENELRHGDKIRLGYTVVEFSESSDDEGPAEDKRPRKRKSKVMAAKYAAMGKDLTDSRKLISAKGRFCEGCGGMIDPEEFVEGRARQMDSFYLCPECVAIVEEKGISPMNVVGYRKWKEQERSREDDDDSNETTQGLEPVE